MCGDVRLQRTCICSIACSIVLRTLFFCPVCAILTSVFTQTSFNISRSTSPVRAASWTRMEIAPRSQAVSDAFSLRHTLWRALTMSGIGAAGALSADRISLSMSSSTPPLSTTRCLPLPV